MQPRFETLTPKHLAGRCAIMSLQNFRNYELWRYFMNTKRGIPNTVGSNLYSVQVYPTDYFIKFAPAKEFEQWAAIEVSSFNGLPDDYARMTLPGGLYAVFTHKGPASTGTQTLAYIFNEWLPASDHVLDDRPHFELMDHRYKNESPDSEDEIWVPVQLKQ